jgi:hypothetical protein
VVLAGGVFRTEDAQFYARLETGVRSHMPKAHTVRLTAPPVLGAALLGLDRLSLTQRGAAETRLRGELTAQAIHPL